MIDITKIQTFDVPPSLKSIQVSQTSMTAEIKTLRVILGITAIGLVVIYFYRKKKKNEQ